VGDTKELLERTRAQFVPSGDVMAELVHRRALKQRNRRIGTAVVALVLALVAIVGLARTFRSDSRPASKPTPGKPGLNVFGKVHGWIAYPLDRYPGRDFAITTVDPAHVWRQWALASHPGDLPVNWSRDGNRLLVVHRVPHQIRLYVLNSNGTETPASPKGVGWGSLSPDGNKVVYIATDYRSLYVYDLQTRVSRQVVAPRTGEFYLSSAWSPDGSRIAFTSDHAVFVVNADGTGRRTVVEFPATPYYYEPGNLAWSPDGSRLAFLAGQWRKSRVFVMGADGAGVRAISALGENVSLAWSPDSARIAFTRGSRLFTMAPDGTSVRFLRRLTPHIEDFIAWNPGP
jgi:dipeptidyl aminopeptidase/acylaminoacyl peptidase